MLHQECLTNRHTCTGKNIKTEVMQHVYSYSYFVCVGGFVERPSIFSGYLVLIFINNVLDTLME